MIKKFIEIITIGLLLCCSIIPISADDTDTATVNYHVDNSYTWLIHATIDFGSNAGVNQTVDRTAQIGQDNIGISVTKNVIPDGATLKIDIDDSQTFVLTNGNSSLNYVVKKTSNGDAMSAGDNVLEIAAGTNTGSQALYFTLSTGTGTSEVAGTYSGTITYQAYIDVPAPVQLNSIGGVIFYDNGDNGATYTWYDENEHVITPETIVGNTDIRYYTVSGSPSEDRFYVIATNPSSGYPTWAHSKSWTYYDGSNWVFENVGTTNGIGAGKTNTALVMSKDNGAYIKSAEEMGQTYDTIWYYINDINNSNLYGCNDWYLGSAAEHDKYMQFTGATYSSSGVVTSNEGGADYMTVWLVYGSSTLWANGFKKNENINVTRYSFFRSF